MLGLLIIHLIYFLKRSFLHAVVMSTFIKYRLTFNDTKDTAIVAVFCSRVFSSKSSIANPIARNTLHRVL